jgi:CHAD domain
MKAERVRGLDPDGTLADNAERVVLARLGELCDFMPRAADPEQQKALHDMRIAAKRLRYVLEITTQCFGTYARKATKRTKDLQALLGDIHDCDMQRPDVERLLDMLRAEDLAVALDSPPGGRPELAAALVEGAPNIEAYDGLVALSTALHVRRDRLFQEFLRTWLDLERKGFRARLEYAVGERPEAVEPDAAEVVAPARGVPDTGQSVSSAMPVSREPELL